MSTTTSKAVILDSPSQWEDWYFVVESMAQDANVWDYINPNLSAQPDIPTLPLQPTASTINPDATSLVDLDINERDLYKLLFAEFKEEKAHVAKILDELKAINHHIVTTISATNIAYIRDKKTGYGRLTALKQRLAPTDYARKLEVIQKWNKLKIFSKKEGVEKWLMEWEVTYNEAKTLGLPHVSGILPLLDFAQAISPIDSNHASSLNYELYGKRDDDPTLPSLYEVIEKFRNIQRQSSAAAKGSSHSGFVTLKGEDQATSSSDSTSTAPATTGTSNQKDQSNTPRTPCLCGGKYHRWKMCYYLNPSKRPKDWTGKKEIYELINKEINKKPSGKSRQWFEDNYKYDGFQKESPLLPPKESNQLGSFITHCSFPTSQDFKLYDSWTLDNASDVHVCNNPKRSGYQKTRDANVTDRLFAANTSLPIESFGSVKVNVDTQSGPGVIELTNVALVPGFMANLVSLKRFNDKGVHWNSQFPAKLTRNQVDFCKLHQIDDHWVLERASKVENISSTSTSATAHSSFATSSADRKQVVTAAKMHLILGHASPEVVEKVTNSATDVEIDQSEPCPSTRECESCAISKATQMISRKSVVEEPENGVPFDRTTWDMVGFSEGYNGDRYMSHFQCRQYKFNLVFTHPRKSDALGIFQDAFKYVETQYQGKIRYVRLDGETSLQSNFDRFLAEKGIKSERTATYTPAQNGGAERSGRVIVTKARAMRIEASLPANMWPETVKAAGYVANRTPIQRLGWKTPFECVTKHKPMLAHLHVYGCKAYPLQHNIPRRNKLDPRAHIGHLVGYDSSNIWRIWIPSKGDVIRTRDVIFDDSKVYDPTDLDVGMVLRESAEKLVETLKLPEYQAQANAEDDTLDYFIVDTGDQDQGTDLTSPAGEIQQPQTEKSLIREGGNTHLLTPSRSPTPVAGAMATPQGGPAMATPREGVSASSAIPQLQASDPPARRGPKGPRSEGMDPSNIIQGPRISRRSAHVTALQNTSELSGFYSAFITGVIQSGAKEGGTQGYPSRPTKIVESYATARPYG
jgi:hypothetical protein